MASNYEKLVLSCTQNAQDVTNNQSTITIGVSVQMMNGSSMSNSGVSSIVTVSCNGQTKTFAAPKKYNIGANGSLSIGSVSFVIKHNADGTKAINYSASWKPPYTFDGGTASGNGSKTLTTIPRASTFTIPTSITLDQKLNINITRASSSFTHKLYYYIGSSWVLFASNVTTSYAWTVPKSFANSFTNVRDFTMKIGVDTYQGSTKIGATNKSITVNFPADMVPVLYEPIVEQMDTVVPADWNIFVKGFSKLRIKLSGIGVAGSTIASYSINGGGFQAASNSLTTGIIETAGTITFKCTLKDTRGRSATINKSVYVYDYQPPSVDMSAFRCNADGIENQDGTYVNCVPIFGITSLDGKNTITSSSIEIMDTIYQKTNLISGSHSILGGAISCDQSYIAQLSITDALNKNAKYQMDVPTSKSILDLKANGNGIAFGKASLLDNTVDSAWTIRCDNYIYDKDGRCVTEGQWVNIKLNSGITAGVFGGASTPKYRKFGNTIEIIGSIQLNYTKDVTIANLPFAPSSNVYVLTPCGGPRIARVYVNTAGDLRLEWIQNIDGGAYSGSIWVQVNISFPIIATLGA